MTIDEKLAALRKLMQREGLSAFIFPSTDPHNGEYIPEHWEGRKWISGFTGSAGTAVVTMTSAALWTDSRYFIQAADELRGTEYQLMRERIEGTPTIAEWLAAELHTMEESRGLRSLFGASRGHEIGVDGMVYSAAAVEELISEMRQKGGVTVRTNLDPLKFIWSDRPEIPISSVNIHPLEYCGRTAHEKILDLRKALRTLHADGMLMSALDEIAWTLNLRGTDVHCNPVFVSYLLIDSSSVTLYIDPRKLTPEVSAYLKSEGVKTADYIDVKSGLQHYAEYNILMDPAQTCYGLFRLTKCKEIVRRPSPVAMLKAVKSDEEIAGFRRSMIRDGIALVKFQRWLEDCVKSSARNAENAMESVISAPDGTIITELTVSEKLRTLRAEAPEFRDDSFDTIAAYGPHGAIVHYEPTAETDLPLHPRSFILIDSGAQYCDGTTDITRTIPLGELSEEERHVYTLVLKGHLQLQNLHFPDGACGTQIDAVARMALWKNGYNFMHGTGHGVGSYLNVHEGPHQIRMEYRPAPLHSGMTVTDEPGIYVEGSFGVRIENTLLVSDAGVTAFGRFLCFEPLTLCPISKGPILRDLLSPDEIGYFNAYHRYVYDTLAPYLDGEDLAWLADACREI